MIGFPNGAQTAGWKKSFRTVKFRSGKFRGKFISKNLWKAIERTSRGITKPGKVRCEQPFDLFQSAVRSKTDKKIAMKELKRIRILYAENDEDAGFMLSTLLGFADIDVSLARSVKKAFEDAQTENFDAYLLESRFSDGSGLELCRRLHEFNPQTPIVFYSADAYKTDKLEGLAAGA